MQYSATFRHIDRDFSFEDLEFGKWNAEYESEEDFVLALNRMAISSSQNTVVDFPEVEVRAKSARVIIRAIDGQLFFTDIHSQNRKDLKVVPVEILRLIDGRSLEEVFKREEALEDDVYVPPKHHDRSGAGWLSKLVAVLLMLVVLSFCAHFTWKDIAHAPRLHAAPQFIPSLSEESDVLRKYADVYVSEYREGAMIFELTREGQFSRFEMWHSEERNRFVLIPVDSYPVQVGAHNGETAMLADEVYLLMPEGDEIMTLHGVSFNRHHADLASIGEVLDVKR